MTEEQNMADNSKSLDKMTVKELREVAKGLGGLTGFSSMKKDELLEKIMSSQGVKKVESKPKKHVHTRKSPKLLTVRDIKNEIIRLREDKAAAQKNGDTERAGIIRHRISRLKKKTRKIAAI